MGLVKIDVLALYMDLQKRYGFEPSFQGLVKFKKDIETLGIIFKS